MIRFITSSFAWRFAGGFALGALGMIAMHAVQPALPANPYSANHAVR